MEMTNTADAKPRLLIPALSSFYKYTDQLAWLVVRLAAGGTMLVHGIGKLMTTSVAAFAAGSMAKRGIEPAMPMAYIIFFNETIGALCIMLGLFTRFVAAAMAIEIAVLTFLIFFPHGYGWTSQGGGWEYPFFWGLVVFAIALRGGGPWSLDRKIGWEL
jgi:putative oxidoreductase